LPKENNEKKCPSFFVHTKERSKKASLKLPFLNFLVLQQESYKEMPFFLCSHKEKKQRKVTTA